MIVDALRALGRPAHAPEIYREICRLFPGERFGNTPVASIRARLQESCPQSGQFTGRRSLFRRISPVETREGLWSLLEQANTPLRDNMLDDLKNIGLSQGDEETERTTLAQARIGQGKFRRDLCVAWNSACAVTNIAIPELIRASHIKPWRESNNEERLDPNNGLLLMANIDAAFDKYLISFEDNGSMIFSRELGENPHLLLGIQENASINRPLNQQQKNYLREHRKKLR